MANLHRTDWLTGMEGKLYEMQKAKERAWVAR